MKSTLYWMAFVGRAFTDLSGPINELGEAVLQLSSAVGEVYSASTGISVEETETSIIVESDTL
tara:strand:- start:284 stop:472 length:189 start_codon:yes stop_codon:yes gene_type:complete